MRLIDAYRKFIEWRGLKRGERTINGDVSHLSQFCLYMKDPNYEVENITLDDCLSFLKLYREIGFDENTIQKKALALKMLFEFLTLTSVKVLNPVLIPVPKRNFKFPRVAEESEYRKLLAVIPTEHIKRKGFILYSHIRNKAIITLLWESGARNGEILSLGMDDIDLVKMSARIKTEKSRGNVPFREIFWGLEANEALKKWVEEREKLTEWLDLEDPMALFFGVKEGRKTCPTRGKRLQVNWVSEILRKYSNLAGLKMPLNPHSCRHHFGRELAKKDTSTYGIASLLGHVNVQSSYHYTMLFGKDREELYRKKMGGNGNGSTGNGHAHLNGNGHADGNGNGHAYTHADGNGNGKLHKL